MSANRWKYFRWTPRTAWITFVYVAVVPSVLGYVGYVTEVSGLLSLSTLSALLAVGGRSHWEEEKREGEKKGPRRNVVLGSSSFGRDADDVGLRTGQIRAEG